MSKRERRENVTKNYSRACMKHACRTARASGPQVSRRRRSHAPQVNCGCSGVAASVSPRSTEGEHFITDMLSTFPFWKRVGHTAA